MNALSKRIGVLVASAAVAFGVAAVAAPAASAETVATASTTVTVATARPSSWWWCKPAHTGRHWRWDDGRRGGHWDERVWDRRQHRWEWKHQWRDNRYCAPVRTDGPPRRS